MHYLVGGIANSAAKSLEDGNQNRKLCLKFQSEKKVGKFYIRSLKLKRFKKIDSLDSIPLPSPSVKIQIIVGKVYLR